jgi:cation:H+ antiporter
MALALVQFLASAATIYLACEFFTNGVEWVGRKFDISQTATGTVLAAFGTALPESVVTFIAVVFGKSAAEKDIGVGAAVGGPLVLSTIAYAVVGVTLVACRRRLGRSTDKLDADYSQLSRDQGWFLLIYAAKIGLGLVTFAFKPWLGATFLAAYALYFRKEMGSRRHGEVELEIEPLRLRPGAARGGWAVLQTILALLAIFAASRVFVSQLDVIGPWLGLSPQTVALLLSPIATELPETMNAIIWVRQGKERLALANISGAMMIQATVPTAFGLFFTPWLLDSALLIAAAATALAIATLFILFRSGAANCSRLVWLSCFYLLFAGGLLIR